jgi:hypothetical protein
MRLSELIPWESFGLLRKCDYTHERMSTAVLKRIDLMVL